MDPTASDSALLSQFATSGDEEAFAAIVRRYAPMVAGVCRRQLPSAAVPLIDLIDVNVSFAPLLISKLADAPEEGKEILAILGQEARDWQDAVTQLEYLSNDPVGFLDQNIQELNSSLGVFERALSGLPEGEWDRVQAWAESRLSGGELAAFRAAQVRRMLNVDFEEAMRIAEQIGPQHGEPYSAAFVPLANALALTEGSDTAFEFVNALEGSTRIRAFVSVTAQLARKGGESEAVEWVGRFSENKADFLRGVGVLVQALPPDSAVALAQTAVSEGIEKGYPEIAGKVAAAAGHVAREGSPDQAAEILRSSLVQAASGDGHCNRIEEGDPYFKTAISVANQWTRFGEGERALQWIADLPHLGRTERKAILAEVLKVGAHIENPETIAKWVDAAGFSAREAGGYHKEIASRAAGP